MEAGSVDTSGPLGNPVNTVRFQLFNRRGRWGERHSGAVVNIAHVAPQHGLHSGQSVAGSVGRHFGLVNRDRRDVELLASLHRTPAQQERGGNVHNIGREISQDAANASHTAGRYTQPFVSGERQ